MRELPPLMVHTEAGDRPYYADLAKQLSDQPIIDVSPQPAIENAPQPPAAPEQMADDDKIITKQGTRYLPLAVAAQHAHVSRQTLNNWINAKVEFQGRPLDAYYSSSFGRWLLAEESIKRISNRFVFWPSGKPAHGVRADDDGNYLSISQTARTLGVTPQTIHNWITNETVPQGAQLRVVKCTASGMFYVNRIDVAEVKTLIPRSGLRPGRRPQPQPALG